MAGDQHTSMQDGMKKIFTQISQLTLLPDADMEFLSKLQAVVRGYLTSQAGAMAHGGAGGPGGAPGGPPGGGMPPGAGGPPPGVGGGGMGLTPDQTGTPPPGGMGGGSPGVSGAPNNDELRRLLGGAA